MSAQDRRRTPRWRGGRGLAGATRSLLRTRLAAARAEAALPFLAAVVEQAAHPLGAPTPADAAAHERAVAERVLRILLPDPAADRAPGAGAMPHPLHHDPSLLAVLFQNIDLLYQHSYPAADAVSLRVMDALHALEADQG